LIRELRPIFPHYSFLKNQSFNARYKALPFSAAKVGECETIHLAAIISELRRHMTIT
jgi:hypothetical protein